MSFAQWTPAGQLRHAVYVGLREDKPPEEVRREAAGSSASPAPQAAPAPVTARTGRAPAAPKRALSHPERVIDPQSGVSKAALAHFYAEIGPWLLPELKGRACSLLRAPDGVAGHAFFQKHWAGAPAPGLRSLDPALWPGHEPLIEVTGAHGLAHCVQLNAIEFHTWNARTRAMDRPDRLVFDLDPGEGLAWSELQEAALLTRALLSELGLRSWLKTSGGKGLHLVVPLVARHDWSEVKGFAKAVVLHLAKVIPQRFVARSGPKHRVGKVFVDYLRNGEGATTVAAYSVRARPGLGVSMPVDWDDLMHLRGGDHWHVSDCLQHLAERPSDPWQDLAACRQSLGPARRRLLG